jgi:DnaJ-domain-containing protein 1
MLIDTKIVKRLNFPFCKTNAIYLLVDYMERNEEIQTMQQRIPVLIDFMEWMYAHDYRLLTQDGLNEYIPFLYKKDSYAELRFCFIKSFCKYLIDEGFCGFVSFSSNAQESENPSAQDCDSKENKEEQSKKRRGRPRKSESQPEEKSDSCNQNVNNNDGEKPKKRRGRPRKSEQQTDTENETDKQSESTYRSNDRAEEQSKKRRGRPRKSEQNHTNDDTNNAESNNSEKKRRGRPPKGSVPKLKRVTNYYDALGVSPNADIDEIKKVYRKMAMEMHPDLHRDDPLAEKRITALNMIMSVLKDDVERMVYDVAMGFIDYDEGMENVTYKEIKWHTKRYYTVWM